MAGEADGHSRRQRPRKCQRRAANLGSKAWHRDPLHEPGKRQQNAYVERYNRTVRQEWFGQFIFNTIEEVKEHATSWLWSCNNERPNMGIGGITPAMSRRQA